MSQRSTLPIPPHPDVVIESEQRVWSGRFPLDVVKFRHRRFDGTLSNTRTWELWRRGRAAALLPYDPIADALVLIEQFRFPALAAGVDPTLVELPAGLCEDNEDPADAIRREMREEMNLEADRVEPIGGFLLTAGGSDEFCHLYAGRVTAPPADGEGIAGQGGEASENEDIRIRVWSADEAIEAAFAGYFTNSITAIALFWLATRRDRLRRKWMTP
jgi:ADP-ribose pyrophosphatase